VSSRPESLALSLKPPVPRTATDHALVAADDARAARGAYTIPGPAACGDKDVIVTEMS
jgi:hypothetical protein